MDRSRSGGLEVRHVREKFRLDLPARRHLGYRACACIRWVLAGVLLCVAATAAHAQSRDVVCRNGDGNFDAVFVSGVEVRVAAARNGKLATRACEASVRWDQKLIEVAPSAAVIDVDVFGVDLGLGPAVTAFQVKQNDEDCCASYRIYSLRKPSKLLRTISGGGYFSAADTDLDGRVEIWTDDGAAVNGFENLSLQDLDAPPTLVLRYEHGHLVDVSAEFQEAYDQQIAKLRAGLKPEDVEAFKKSNGRLGGLTAFSEEELKRLQGIRRAKIKALEIVWAYLYSGREDEAWRTLGELWPASDVDRIRAAILAARNRGIRSQVESVSKGVPPGGKRETSVFEGLIGFGHRHELDALPQPILLRRAVPANPAEERLAAGEVRLVLVVDEAGKVRSAVPADQSEWTDQGLKASIAGWKFIPALKNGRAVASRIGYAVSLEQ